MSAKISPDTQLAFGLAYMDASAESRKAQYEADMKSMRYDFLIAALVVVITLFGSVLMGVAEQKRAQSRSHEAQPR
ncbi:MAG: hypothetical protein G01um101419_299 [Parcubacteria group bacterium Gr01-1014_19]|nr:MAG: hypothetical protein G01um101419_299 [Parcubacteria group bacterium Gr01-1014_19]